MRPLRRAIIPGRNRWVRCISAAAFTCTIASSRPRSVRRERAVGAEAGAVDQELDVDAPLLQLLEDPPRRDRIGEILGDDARRDAVFGGQPGRQRLQVIAAARDDDQIVPIEREQPRQLQPQPRGRSRDQCGFSHLLDPCNTSRSRAKRETAATVGCTLARMPAATRNVLVSCVLIAGCGAATPSGARWSASRARGELTWGADEQGGEPYVFEDAAPRRRAGRLRGGPRGRARARAGGARAFRPERLDDADPVAGARDVRHRDERHRGDAGARGAGRVLAPVLPVSPNAWSRAGATRACAIWRRLRGCASGTLAGSLAWQLARDAGADAVPYEGVDEPFVDLAHERIDAVLLDDIIVARYASRHPTLAVVADVADGRYAIAMRPAGREPAPAIDRALARADRVGGVAADARALAARRPAPGGAGGGARQRAGAPAGAAPLSARQLAAVPAGRAGDVADLAGGDGAGGAAGPRAGAASG